MFSGKKKYIFGGIASIIFLLLLTGVAFAEFSLDVGITPIQTCEGYGLLVSPPQSQIDDDGNKLSWYQVKVNDGDWLSYGFPRSFAGTWDSSDQYDYEVYLRFKKYAQTPDGYWNKYLGVVTVGPYYFNLTKPDFCVPTKAEVLIKSGVPGKGLLSAPGLNRYFNPLSEAEVNAGIPE